MDDEVRQYLERLRQENMKAYVETWRQIGAFERRLDALAADNAAGHAETRLHIDHLVERLERQLTLFSVEPETSSAAEVHFRHDR